MDRLGSLLGTTVNSYATAPAYSAGAALGRTLAPRTATDPVALLGSQLASPATALGSTLGAAVATPLPARMPSLYYDTPALGFDRAKRAVGSTSSTADFFARHMPGRGGDALGDLLGGLHPGAMSFAQQFGQRIGGQVGTPFQPTGRSFAGGNLDPAAGAINAAAAKWGVPANFLAAIIAHESSGDWAANNRYSYIRPQAGPLLPYVGVFESTARSRGLGDLWDRAYGNRDVQIDMLAGVLRSQYDQLKGQNPAYNWLNVASYHFSGRPNPDGWSDELGTSNSGYYNNIKNWWGRLEPGYNPDGGVAGAASSLGQQMGGSISTMLGGTPMNISQDFGLTPFARQHLNGMYAYAPNYGVQGHAGLDISMNPGTTLYSPVSGTVIRTGGTGYYTDERYGNQAGSGELRLKLDNGDEVILGHMQSIGVTVGQRVTAGQPVGLSGTANGGHVHLEYRQYTPGATASGYTAIDPRTAMSGSPLTGGGYATMPSQSLGSNFEDAARIMWDQGFRSQYA